MSFKEAEHENDSNLRGDLTNVRPDAGAAEELTPTIPQKICLFRFWVVFAGFYYRGIKIDPNVVEDVRVNL